MNYVHVYIVEPVSWGSHQVKNMSQSRSFTEQAHTEFILGADYMEIFITGWNFNSVYRVEKNCNCMKKINLGWKYFNPGRNVLASSK